MMDELNREGLPEEEETRTQPERQDWWPAQDEVPAETKPEETWPAEPDAESGVYSSNERKKDYIGLKTVCTDDEEPIREPVRPEPFMAGDESGNRTRKNFHPDDYDYRDGQTPQDKVSQSSYDQVSVPVRNPFVFPAIVCGILSLGLMVTGIGGLFFGAMGIILAVLSRGRSRMEGKAKAGMGISLVGFCISLFITASAFGMILHMTTADMKALFKQYGYTLVLPEEKEELPILPKESDGAAEEKEKTPDQIEKEDPIDVPELFSGGNQSAVEV